MGEREGGEARESIKAQAVVMLQDAREGRFPLENSSQLVANEAGKLLKAAGISLEEVGSNVEEVLELMKQERIARARTALEQVRGGDLKALDGMEINLGAAEVPPESIGMSKEELDGFKEQARQEQLKNNLQKDLVDFRNGTREPRAGVAGRIKESLAKLGVGPEAYGISQEELRGFEERGKMADAKNALADLRYRQEEVRNPQGVMQRVALARGFSGASLKRSIEEMRARMVRDGLSLESIGATEADFEMPPGIAIAEPPEVSYE